MAALLRLGDGYVDLDRRCVVRDHQPEVALTPTEHRLLAYLAERPAAVVSLEELMLRVWHYAPTVRSRAPYVAIQRLRTKIEVDAGSPRHLVSVHGTGYRLDLVETPAVAVVIQPDAASTAFFGRQAESTTLAAAWSAGARLVTLIGPGGVGKTRLVGEHVRAGTPGLEGVATEWVWLVEVRDGTGLAGAVAHALQVALPGGDDEVRQLERIGRVLHNRGPMLLVLDNAEQVRTPVALAVAGWLEQAPELRVLVTSRHALELPAEHPLVLGPLDADAAVALLVDRAGRVRWGYEPAPEDASLIRTLVHEDLDGMPLAIELAAARLATMGVRGVAERLHERFRLLSGGRGDAQWSSLLEALMWSWELLSDVERSVLAQCSVFSGGFDAASAERVIDVGDAWVPDVLGALVDHSLLQIRDRHGGVRFHLLESVRDLAKLQLVQETGAQARHRQWVCEAVSPRVRELSGARAPEALAVLLRERGNIRAAHTSALQDGDLDRAVSLAEVLDTLAQRRGPFAERLERVDATLAVLPEDHPDRVALLWRRGDALRMLGHFDEAQQVLESAVDVGRPLGRCAEPLTALLAVLAHKSDLDGHRALIEEALAATIREGDRRRQCIVIHNHGILERSTGSLVRAEALAEEALAIAQAIGDVELQVGVLASLASTATTAGRPRDALTRIGQGMHLARAHALDTMRVTLLVNLAHLHRRLGDPDTADATYVETLALARQIGDRRVENLVSMGRAVLALDRGDFEVALAGLDALERAQAGDQENHVIDTSIVRGIVLRASGDLAGAERELRAARRSAGDRDAVQQRDFAGVHLAATLVEGGRVDEAVALLETLREAYASREDPVGPRWLVVVEAAVQRARGRADEAEALIASVAGSGEEVDRLVGLLRRSA